VTRRPPGKAALNASIRRKRTSSGGTKVRPLSPQQERRLRLIFDRYWSDGGACDADGLARAVARFAFEEALVFVPADPDVRRTHVFFPVSADGDVRALALEDL
jgi:hypothetical protein